MKVKIPTVYVTMFCGCPYFNYFVARETWWLRRAEWGRRMHEKILKEFEYMGYKVEFSVSERYHETLIKGRIDACYETEDSIVIVELKPLKPKIPQAWYEQVSMYWWMMRRRTSKPVIPIIAMYINDGVEACIPVPEEKCDEYYPRVLRRISEFIATGVPPRVRCEVCELCPAREECMKRFNRRKVYVSISRWFDV